jgi:hypothetical protein
VQQVALARFTVVDSSSQEAIARLGNADLEVDDVDDSGHVIAECDQSDLATASLDFPNALVLRSEDGFGAFLFHEVAVYTDGGQYDWRVHLSSARQILGRQEGTRDTPRRN